MGHSIEPKMDELKKLLRRLDGLDGSKGLINTAQESSEEQRGYVGALRGTPEHAADDERINPPPPASAAASRSAAPAALWAAGAAALITSVAAYLVIAHNEASRSDPRKRTSGDAGLSQRGSSMQSGLIRSAEQLLDAGDLEAARALLQRAAELGSGEAALKLGRSYDPTQAKRPSFADSQTNPALARAWYERALSLGTQEAAAFIQPGVR